MRDLEAIIQARQNRDPAEGPLALATVVKVEGSAYRRPGARMLVYPDGRRIGSVSGGCLEADVVERARQAMATGTPTFVLYDSRSANGDLVAELGCKGAVGILIERAADPGVTQSLAFLRALTAERGNGVMATVFRVEGRCPVALGSRLMQRDDSLPQGNGNETALREMAFADMESVRRSGKAQIQTYIFPNGCAEALIEPVQPPLALLLCGAGEDARPLAQMARMLGWQVSVVDVRPDRLTPERFPGATRLATRPECLSQHIALDARTAAILMSHNYAQDLNWLQTLLPSLLPYIGILGPRKRWEQMQADLLHDAGVTLSAACLERLHSPVGLDIGSETPEEIALSILAEIQAVLNDRTGGFLRERKGGIHTDMASKTSIAKMVSYRRSVCPLSA